MSKKRLYDQNCSLAFALDTIGDRWTVLIIRDLLPGPRSFTTLASDLKGIGTNLLTSRLKELLAADIVTKKSLTPGSKTKLWALTDQGRELEPIVIQLAQWGLRHLSNRYSDENHWSPLWNYVACKARFSPKKSIGLRTNGTFEIDSYSYWIEVQDGSFSFHEGSRPDGDFDLCCTAEEFKGFLSGSLDPNEFAKTSVSGDRAMFFRCVQCFI